MKLSRTTSCWSLPPTQDTKPDVPSAAVTVDPSVSRSKK